MCWLMVLTAGEGYTCASILVERATVLVCIFAPPEMRNYLGWTVI